MGYNPGGGEGNERVFNGERANKWTDTTVPLSGVLSGSTQNTIYLSGASPQGVFLSGASELNQMHVIVSANKIYLAAHSAAFSASSQNQYWPADVPYFHIPKSGSSEYISVAQRDSTGIEVWISIAERTEG